MEEYIKELDRYEHYKFSYSIDDVKELLAQKFFIASFTKKINDDMGMTYLDEHEFSVFIFITKKNEIYQKPLKFVFNDFSSKLFGTKTILGKSKYPDSIQSFFDEIENNNKIEQSDFKIDFFVFSEDKKQKSEKLNYLFKLIRKEFDKFKDTVDELHINSPIQNFLVDTTNFVSKHWIFISGVLTLMVYMFNRYKLLSLGYPKEIISTIEILSVLKLYAMAYIPYLIWLPLVIIIFIYGASKYEKIEVFYLFLKGLSAIIIYGVFITFVYNFSLMTFKKQNIKKDDSFLIEYLYEGFYPRVTKNNNDEKLLLLGEANKKIYYYNFKDLKNDNQSKLCQTLKKEKSNPLEMSVIQILKNSNFPHTKNITQTNNIENFKIYNKDTSLEELKKIYCTN